MWQDPRSKTDQLKCPNWTPRSDEMIEQGIQSLRFLLMSDIVADHLSELIKDGINPRLCYWKSKYNLPVPSIYWQGKNLDHDKWLGTFTGFLHSELPLRLAFISFAMSYVASLKTASPEWEEFLNNDKSRSDDLIMWVIHPEIQIFAHALTRGITLADAELEYTALKVNTG